MTKKPIISVVMPVYNSEKYVSEAIKSILKQTFKDFELIIIDDCSTDKTFKIINEYTKQDTRIKYFRNQQNLGCTASLNKGLKHAKGKYLARMDADDVSHKERFKEQVKILDKGYDLVGTNIIFVDEKGKKKGTRKYSEDIKKIIRLESPLAHPSTMFRTSFLKKTGTYNEKYYSAQDYDLWIRFYLNNAKITNIQKELLKYRLHKETIKNIKTKNTIRNTIIIKKEAKKKGLKLGLKGELRLLTEQLILLMPKKIILLLFKILKKRK